VRRREAKTGISNFQHDERRKHEKNIQSGTEVDTRDVRSDVIDQTAIGNDGTSLAREDHRLAVFGGKRPEDEVK
jgi:hypothetical protein